MSRRRDAGRDARPDGATGDGPIAGDPGDGAGTGPAGAEQEAPRARPVFFVAMLLIPFVLLGAVEGALRVVGFGESLPMWVPASDDGTWMRMNPRVAERWFFGDVDAPGATYDPFRAERTDGSLRIVVQGGSSALGFPYFYGGAFPRMLEHHLRRAFPDREVEVVNTALTAVNSHTLRDIADEVVEIEPDAVLIYAGHNEYYGALGVASSVSGGSPTVVRAYLAARNLRIVQAIAAVRDAIVGSRPAEAGAEGDGPGETTMARMVAEQRIPLDSELLAAGEAQLRSNLGDVLAIYRRAGIPVFVGTLVSNERDQPPFISGEPDPDVDWREIETVAAEAIAARDPGMLQPLVAELETRDRTHADGFFSLGRVFEGLGDTATARRMYLAARDRDQLRFRAPTRFNDVLRELAAEHGATVVESEAAFRAASPGGIVGSSLITEHLHPDLDGYHILEETFFDALMAAGIPGPPTGETDYPRSVIPATPVDSAYAGFLIESLTAGWPFQTDPEVERTLVAELFDRQPESIEGRLGMALFRRRVGWEQAQQELMGRYERDERWDDARRVATALSLEDALGYVPKARAGAFALRLGDRAAARRWFEEAAALAPPTDPLPAAILRSIRSLDDLEAAVAAAPDSENRYDLAAAWALLNQPERAIAVLDALLIDDPGNARAESLRATISGESGRRPPG